jgi:hypothetical protein
MPDATETEGVNVLEKPAELLELKSIRGMGNG